MPPSKSAEEEVSHAGYQEEHGGAVLDLVHIMLHCEHYCAPVTRVTRNLHLVALLAKKEVLLLVMDRDHQLTSALYRR